MVVARKVTRKRVVRGKAVAMPVSSGRKAWKWVAGVHVFPEAICPFCNVTMRSSCIWQFDESRQKLVQIARIDKDRLVKLSVLHPHVGSGGYVCMGSTATSVSQALLLSMNPSDCMGFFEPQKTGTTWKAFFARYFPDHRHLEKRRVARPKLFKRAAKAVAR